MRSGWKARFGSSEMSIRRSRGKAQSSSSMASPFKAGYVSAKHGVIGLVKTLALEGADKAIACLDAFIGLGVSSREHAPRWLTLPETPSPCKAAS